MKRPLLSFCTCLVAAPFLTAGDPEVDTLLARLPTPPRQLCEHENPARTEFFNELNKVNREIDTLYRTRRKKQKEYAKQHEAEWREQMLKQSGLTSEQIAAAKAASKSKDPKVRAAAKRQLAEAALQQYADLTIDEARQLKVPKKDSSGARPAITDEATKAWAEQEMAVAKATAQARTPDEVAAEEQKQARLKKLAELADEQKKRLDHATAGAAVVRERMRKLDDEAREWYAAAIPPLNEQIERCKEAIKQLSEGAERHSHDTSRGSDSSHSSSGSASSSSSSGGTGTGNDQEAIDKATEPWRKMLEELEVQKSEALRQYCENFTPRYCDLIGQYLTWARSALPELNEYDERENERLPLLTDSAGPGSTPLTGMSTTSLDTVMTGADLLRDCLRYARESLDRPDPEHVKEAKEGGAEG